MRQNRAIISSMLSAALTVAGCADSRTSVEVPMTTWSIAAMDVATGDVGVAAATCIPNVHADALAALVPGVGVGVTQAYWTLENRNRVFSALTDGLVAEDVIAYVADADFDAGLARRQYGVVTLAGGEVRVAGYTGSDAPDWSGTAHDDGMAVAVQGNTLIGEAVVQDSMTAFRRDDPAGGNWLSDRLLRALEAGSRAGGDVRCNNAEVQSTASTAFILVARGQDQPYAAADIDQSDQGTDAGPWLAISVAGPREGPNPIVEVRRRYDAWRGNR